MLVHNPALYDKIYGRPLDRQTSGEAAGISFRPNWDQAPTQGSGMQNNMGNIQAAQREPAMGGRQAPFFSRLRQMMQRRQPQRRPQPMQDQGPANLGQRSMGQAVMDARQRGFNPASQFKQQAQRLDQGIGRGGRF